jgi:aspartate ammonia-lyase
MPILKMKCPILFALIFFVGPGRAVFGQEYRTETDLLGNMEIPADAYYGIQTARALQNFQISGQQINDYPQFMRAWGMVKLAAARANHQAGKMPEETLKLIETGPS